jgi:DNA polymerase-3 subunit epsilon
MATNTLDSHINTLLPLEAEYVFTDIETESLMGLLLLQIAAITLNGLQFNVFINPFRPLPEDCSKLLGFYYYNNQLYRNGRELKTRTIKQALLDFTTFITNIKKPVVLVYHNGFAFDCSILANYLIRFNVPVPSNLITVCDSLPFFRNFFKDKNVVNHKLGTLAAHYGIAHEHAHCALSDSKVLMDICEKIRTQNNLTFQQMFKNSFRKFSDYIVRITEGKPLTPLIKEKKPRKTKTKTKTK